MQLSDTWKNIKAKFNLTDDFLDALNGTAKRVGINPADLLSVMHFESGINPRAVNKYSGASGLIQFMPTTAKGLGTSVEAIRKMDAIEQMPLVEKYLWPYRGKMKNLADVYLAVFFPAAIGKPNSYVLKTSKLSAGLIAKQNPVFDTNKDGTITKGEILAIVNKKAEKAGLRTTIGPIALVLVAVIGLFFLIKK